MQLRPYQHKLYQDVRACVSQGHKRVLVVLATGGGKTVVFAFITASAVVKGRRVVILADRSELLDQTADKLASFGVHASICRADDPRYDASNPVQVCSTQTLLARDLRPAADILIVDECHKYARGAPEWSAILDAYPDATILGFTATPQRADESPLGDLFTALVVGPPHADLITQGHLLDATIWAPPERLEGSLCGDPVAVYAEHGQGLPALFFVSSVAESIRVAAAVPGCVSVDANTRDRAQIIEAFRSGAIAHLSSVGVLTTGFDAPRAKCAVMAVSNASDGIWCQRAGRVLRPYPGRHRALILDLSGAVWEHGHPCDPRTYSLDGKGMRRTTTASPGLWQCRVCYWFAPGPCRRCPQCGAVMPPPKPPRVTARELAETAWVCGCGAAGRVMPLACPECGEETVRGRRAREEGTDARQAYLLRLAKEAVAKGYKPGWVRWKVTSKYGAAPDWRSVDAAMQEVRRAG